jgi:chromosome segregation ATPase
MRLSTGSRDEHSNPFIENHDSSINENLSVLSHGFTRRFSERFSVNINQNQLDLQASLRRLERKVETLTENLEDQSSALESEQKRNENLNELILNAQEKIKTKDGKINNLQNEIKILEGIIEEVEKNREVEVARILKDSSEEVEKIKNLLNVEKEKSRKNDLNNKEIIENINSQIKEMIKNNKILISEKESLNKNIARLSEEVETLHRKHQKVQSKLSKKFETEKESWEIEHKAKIDELKFQIKAFEDLQDMHSCSEHTENELSELDEHNRHVNSEPFTFITFDKKVSYESIKFLESFDPMIDESLTSAKSQQVSSTCQTEEEIIGVEDFDTLLVEKTEIEKKLKNCQEKKEEVELMLNRFFKFFREIALKLNFSVGDNIEEKDFQFIIENTHQSYGRRVNDLKSQLQSSFMVNRKRKNNKPCWLFWQKTNPIVSSLFA